MSSEPVEHPTVAVHAGEGQAVGGVASGAGEVAKTGAPTSKAPQPFKLPYSNQFDVEFKDVHLMKEDRKYSEPVTFGPLKWCVLWGIHEF